MSSIDAVIAQARRPGNFSERRRFTLARSQAIQKLRQFALADPAAYILELVQSAIANGASWIQIERERDSVTLAYIGGGIPEEALGRLFDFLFASKDSAELGYLRELAIGINALLSFEPDRVVIESGDGSLAGTTRMELVPGKDSLDVGRPDHALAGTFIRAEGLRRSRDIERERRVLEVRCLTAPVAILYNGEPMFGYSTQRIPGLLGYGRRISFDEGDLYGTIGERTSDVRAEFALLTRGVLIEAVEHELLPDVNLGGVVCFDGLRKSADHARIVRDDRFTEMWLRLRPYAQALLGEKGVHGAVKAHEPGGEPMASAALRSWLRDARKVVIVAPELAIDGGRGVVAKEIAKLLGAKLLCVPPEQVGSLRLLAGRGVTLYTPDPAPAGPDLGFYRLGVSPPPPRPWLVQPIAVTPVTVGQLQPSSVAAALAQAIDGATELRMRVYTPASNEHRRGAEVVLLAEGREIGRSVLPTAHPGHVLVVELGCVAPSQLRNAGHFGPAGGADALVEACLRHAAPALAEASERLLAGLVDVNATLGALERGRALAALARSARLRLRRTAEGRASLCFSLVEPGPPGVDLLGLRLFMRANGEPMCARDLAALIVENEGWLLGVHAVALPGAAEIERVVLVDAELEALLIGMVGEAAYLRVDGTAGNTHGPAASDQQGYSYSAEDVKAALAAGRVVVAHYGHATPAIGRLGRFGRPGDRGPGGVPEELWMPPWSYLALASAGTLLPAQDFHLGDDEAREHGDAQAFIATAAVTGGAVTGIVGVPLVSPPAPGVLVVDERLRHVHRFAEAGHDFGVVGLLRAGSGWSASSTASVAEAVQAAIDRVYADLLARVPGMDPHSPAFARATATMLAHAGRRLAIVADSHGHLCVQEVTPLVDRILRLPLFPGRRGLPLGAWQLVRRFVESDGDVAAMRGELDVKATPPVLLDWLERTLTPASILREAAPEADHPAVDLLELDREGIARARHEPDPDAPLDAATLATTVEYWLHHLRPDLPAQRPWELRGRVWVELEDSASETLADVTGDARYWRLALYPDHWLPDWAARTARRDREALAWLLLACYARINEVFDHVTNNHEGQFQRAVADALEQGRLAVVTPRSV